MMNRRIYLFCWLCLACWLKPVSAEEQALLVIPEPVQAIEIIGKQKNLFSLLSVICIFPIFSIFALFCPFSVIQYTFSTL